MQKKNSCVIDKPIETGPDGLYGEDYYGRPRFGKLISFFPQDGIILDLGCNEGAFLNLLKKHELNGLGVDFDQEKVKTCNDNGLNAIHADVFEFLDQVKNKEKFAGIMLADFVEHFDPFVLQRLLRRCVFLLRPGGVMAIITPNSRSLMMSTWGFYESTIEHHNPYSVNGLKQFLQKEGLVALAGGIDPDSRLKLFSWHPARLLRNLALWILGRIICGKGSMHEHCYLVMKKPLQKKLEQNIDRKVQPVDCND